jgi:hypothetical protein
VISSQDFAAKAKKLAGALKVSSPDVASALRDGFASAYKAGASALAAERGTPIVLGDAADAAAAYADERAGSLITDIDGTTEERVQGIIASGIQAGQSDTEVSSRLSSLFGEDRADLIARTEMATAWNLGVVAALKGAGEEYVYVSDGEDCEDCAPYNGEYWTVEEAEANPLEHPNCVREFRPLTAEELKEVREEEGDDTIGTTDELGDSEAASAEGGEKFYSEDEERDEKGRWTRGTGPAAQREAIQHYKQNMDSRFNRNAHHLNNYLREDRKYGRDAVLEEFHKQLLAYADTHEKPFAGSLWRGTVIRPEVLKAIMKGEETVTASSWLSTSSGKDTAVGFVGRGMGPQQSWPSVMLEFVNPMAATDIGGKEHEFLFRPGATFKTEYRGLMNHRGVQVPRIRLTQIESKPRTKLKLSAESFSIDEDSYLGTRSLFYSEDQLRDERGRWTSSGVAAHERVWRGQQKMLRNQLGKLATGRVAEHIVLQHVKELGLKNPHPMNGGRPNFPIDIRAGNYVIEVKGGQVSNNEKSQQWRITLGSFGPNEQKLYDRMTKDQKKEWNAGKMREAIQRKEDVRKQESRKAGHEIKALTFGVIIHPDKGTADIYRFKGWHERIGWNTQQAKDGYVTTVKYVPKGKR